MRLPSVTTCLWAASVQGAALGPFSPRHQVTDILAQRQSTVTSSDEQSQAVNATGGRAVIEDGYWLNDLSGKGIAAFNKDPAGYTVFRNVKDYGATGDGTTDDSDAINKAISDGGRCGPWVCQSSTDTPAVVYIPKGRYRIAKPIVFYYMTQLIGDPRSRPVLVADPNLDALALIDASPYNNDNGAPAWTSTNIFLRQIRNIVIDGTAVPANKGFQGIHWPASQATTIQNVKIMMRESSDSGHAGIFVENGSGGHMADLEIEGGRYGLNIGNQQFTMRNIKISKAQVGISQIWNWGWLYSGLQISNCGTAFQMINGYDTDKLQVGSVVIIDSEITNCPVFMDTTWSKTTQPIGAGQLILQKIKLNNVPVAITGYGSTILEGGSITIDSWGQGNIYTPERAGDDHDGKFRGAFTAMARPQSLLDNNGNFYSKSKPQYENLAKDRFVSARGAGATGDGKTDDTQAVQRAINEAAGNGKVLFFEHGVYKVTNTIEVPPGSKMVGETFSAIMASGSTWADQDQPKPVIQIGKPGQSGTIEWSDMLVQTQGGTPGAIVIEYNLKTDRGSGLWDVHTRIGGSKGTLHQVEQCPVGSVLPQCFAAHTNVHITKDAKGAYFENNWFWTADHDLDDWNSTRTAIFTGRGMHVEAEDTYLWASGVEHHALYQYQFNNANNIFAGFIQTETPYYMPNPDARNQPFRPSGTYSDPDYSKACPANEICDAFGLRVLKSKNVMIYGGGLYSFFKNYDVHCSSADAPNGYRDCQNQIFSIEGSSSVQWFALNQVGALEMITIDGVDKAKWDDNLSVYSNTIGYFTYSA